MPQHYTSTNFSQQVQYQSALDSRSIIPHQYQANMVEYSQPQAQPTADQPEQEEGQDVDDYERYQGNLRQINQDISEGKLNEAGPALLDLSEWLLDRVSQLGMFNTFKAIARS